MSIYERIRNLRQENNWTQSQLADKLGVTDSTVSSYENGRTDPDIETIKKLGEIFDVSFDYLFCLTDIRKTYQQDNMFVIPKIFNAQDKNMVRDYIEYIKYKKRK